MFFVVLLLFHGFLHLNDAREKNCLLFKHKCVDHCPPKMHPYHTRCDVDTVSQRTCKYPTIYVLGFTCGWSRCDCNGELILNDDFICVPPEKCYISRKPNKRRKGAPGSRHRHLYYRFSPEGELPAVEPDVQGGLGQDPYDIDRGRENADVNDEVPD